MRKKITYWFTIRTSQSLDWSAEKQLSIQFFDWHQFAKFCKELATLNQAKVRGCTMQGYRTSGSYFEPELNLSKIAC